MFYVSVFQCLTGIMIFDKELTKISYVNFLSVLMAVKCLLIQIS